MVYYYKICDKTININKKNHSKRRKHNEISKWKHVKHTIECANFFNIDSILN